MTGTAYFLAEPLIDRGDTMPPFTPTEAGARPTVRTIVLSAALTCLAIASGCATSSRAAIEEPVTLRVANQSWSVGSVYLVWHSSRQRVATVQPLSDAVVRIPYTRFPAEDLFVSVRLLGDDTEFISHRIPLRPGLGIELAFTNSVRSTRVALW